MAGYPLKTGDSAWVYKPIPSFLGGVDYSRRPDELADNQCSNLINVIARQGAIVVDTGYKVFINSTVVGIIQQEYEWEQPDGSITTILITTKSVYRYSPTGPQWRLIPGTNSTTVTFESGPGVVFMTVAAVTGLVVGDLVGIDLVDGTQHQTTITGINGLVVTLAVPTPGTTLAGAAFIRAVQLNGDQDHAVVLDNYAANGWCVFTNGIDTPKRYDGQSCVDIPNLPSSGNTICAAVVVYNASLFLCGTTEGGVAFPYRMRHSDIGDPTNWTTGIAGKDDLLDKPDAIITARRLGPYLIVYREKSIARGQFIGAGGLNYEWDTMVDTEGLVSAYAVTEVGTAKTPDNFHVFVGLNGAYIYRGDFTPEPISDAIFEKVWGSSGNLSPSFSNRTYSIYVKELKEFWFGYPSVQATVPDTVWRYSFTYKIWYQRFFTDTVVNVSTFDGTTDLEWTDLVGSWNDQSQQLTWERLVAAGNSTDIHLAGLSGLVYSYDYVSTTDNGTPIPYTLDTKDFMSPDATLRFDMLEAYMQGDGTQVHYSTNQGKTWRTLGTMTEIPERRARLYQQFIGQRLRFRFTGSDPSFLIEWAGLSYKLETLYDFDDSGDSA